MGDFRASLDQDDVKAGERTAEFGHFVNLSHIEIWGTIVWGLELATYCFADTRLVISMVFSTPIIRWNH